MVKKTKPSQPPEPEATTNIIKLRLTPADAKIIRLAAAINCKQPGSYARDVVVEQARKDVRAAKDDLI